ncbi:Alcohol dehydrogenase superfamily zinc-containing [Macrophomina phaseolina MS6]|uniref:Alcohol dehydrogenase superfamily zinc-containing n=1 Tax=Macrophomina phaseolina (strain MS6) TaxID=1126212 RepID=K2RVS2_MACPH|nr:Alcohol dehydrogenase superfamily zinc-containing [Macrophomina phaseolina MS6]
MPTAIAIRKVDGKPGQVYYPLERLSFPPQTPTSPTHLTIRIAAAALNHRDLFIRQHLYPGTTFGVPLLADGAGVVTATGADPSAKQWLGKRVIVSPGTGWKDDPAGPEADYAILGGTKASPVGTLSEEIVVEASEVEEAPAHLSAVESAALPLTGLTAWRAVVTKSENAAPGRNVLVTGIGGGVALMALLFASAKGARVWVTSGSAEKIEAAKKLGAAGGVSYKEEGWEKKLQGLIGGGGKLDAIIDGAGGDVVEKGAKLLKNGGVIVSYGMTLGPKMPFLMTAVLKNIDLKGSTMGSRLEFKQMVEFVNEKNLKPVISRVVSGIDNIEAIDGLFEDMKKGNQFGKLVIEISKEGESK